VVGHRHDEGLCGGWGWVYIVVALDWYTKVIVGHYAGGRATAQHWLSALHIAVNRQFPESARGQGLSLVSDNGCQPTAIAFREACSSLGTTQAFISYNNPKGNAVTERVMRTLREECLGLNEWTGPIELSRALEAWITDYNKQYLHSSLGYRTPRQFELEYQRSHSSPFVAA
jgi:putative transposase